MGKTSHTQRDYQVYTYTLRVHFNLSAFRKAPWDKITPKILASLAKRVGNVYIHSTVYQNFSKKKLGRKS